MSRSRQASCENRKRIALTQLFRRAVRLAERQWGVVADWQLIECGVSRSAITRWVASAGLHRIHPRVYAVGHTALRTEGTLLAAIRYAGPGAALSYATAAHWWGLLPYLPHITHVSSRKRRRSLNDVRVHVPARFERVMHRGLPVTPVARTLLDFASVAPLAGVRSAVAEADFQRRLKLDEIDRLTGPGRAGSAQLNHVLALHRPEHARTRSPLEDLFLDLYRRHRLPFPEVNVSISGYTVDALWRAERLVVELDGGDGHASYSRMQRDRDRELHLGQAGYSVLRYSWRQVRTRPAAVAGDVRDALGAGSSPPAQAAQGRRHVPRGCPLP